MQSRRTGKPARRFKDFRWRTRTSWSRQRRVVAKAEWTEDEANPRFIVTSLTRAECKARYLYEKVYCARGDMENRIKECQLDLYADRTSTATMRANQLRLWFASMAYVLLCALRRIALHHTPFAKATCGTIRLKLLKIGALVRSECPPHQGCNGVSVSCSRCLGLRCQASRRCRQRAGVARLTRAAATRNPRGITPRPTETTSWPPLRLKKLLLLLASPDATMSRACIRANK